MTRASIQTRGSVVHNNFSNSTRRLPPFPPPYSFIPSFSFSSLRATFAVGGWFALCSPIKRVFVVLTEASSFLLPLPKCSVMRAALLLCAAGLIALASLDAVSASALFRLGDIPQQFTVNPLTIKFRTATGSHLSFPAKMSEDIYTSAFTLLILFMTLSRRHSAYDPVLCLRRRSRLPTADP